MDYRVSPRKVELTGALFARGLVHAAKPIVGVIDLEALGQSVRDLRIAFPPNCLHAYAAKANCSPGVLTHLRGLGMGIEVASRPEFEAAVRAGFPGEKIVFDSPAKTRDDIDSALSRGVILHIDNFQELERVDDLVRIRKPLSPIGIRVNPQVGAGGIVSTSTATSTSKFGVGLGDSGNRDRLISAFTNRPWLRTVHVHVGSQGCPPELAVEAVKRVVELTVSINTACGGSRISAIDIGGGLPVNFTSEESKPTFHDYASQLRTSVPSLFGGSIRMITEFGRALIAKSGFILARVEYTKVMGGRAIAITHAGAQVAARTVYEPEDWPLRISALDANGRPKTGEVLHQDIAGPCCFAGDVLAHNRALPLLEPGDYILVHDTGGYYFSSPYFYNSLPPIEVYGVAGLEANLDLIALT